MPSSALQTLFMQFQAQYPLACLSAELLTIHQEHYVVRALIHLGGTTIATAMAAASELEAAEDRAKFRVLESLVCLPSAPVSNRFEPTTSGGKASAERFEQLRKIEPPEHPASMTAGHYAQPISPTGLEIQAAPLAAGPLLAQPTALPAVRPAMSPEASATSAIPANLPAPLPLGTFSAASAGSEPPVWEAESQADRYSSAQPAGSAIGNSTADYAPADYPPPDYATASYAATNQAVESPLSSALTSSLRTSKERSSKRPAEVPAAPVAVEKPAEPADRSEEIMRIGIEMKRLGWSTEQGREYLKRTYGKASRSKLDDAELLDFLHYLEMQPSPLQTPF